MALILNVEVDVLQFGDDICQLLVGWAKEDAVVHIDDKDDVSTIKDTVVYQWLLEFYLEKFGNQVRIPYATCLLLTIEIG